MNNQWKIFAQKTHAIEKKYIPLLKKVIVDFRSSFINDLTLHGQHTAVNNLQSSPVSDIAPILKNIYRTAGLMGAKLTASELKQMAAQKDGGFGRNETWIRDVQNYLKLHGLELASKITDTMKEDINKILQKAVENGWSIDETVKALKATNLIEARAQTIARTEIIRAANVGHSIAASSMPYEVDKKWIAANDHRTRHSHVKANGHTTDEYGTFKVPIYKGDVQIGTDEMQFPGDPSAHASNTINCRCRVIYIPKRDSQGKLIMRRSTTATIIPMRSPNTGIPAHQIAAALKANIRIGVDETE